jgi:hypothetical protein
MLLRIKIGTVNRRESKGRKFFSDLHAAGCAGLDFAVKFFFEVLSFFLRYRLPLGYISAVGVEGDWRSQSPKINSTSKKELTGIP